MDKQQGKQQWEHVAYATERLTVPGGWLYRTTVGNVVAMAFVPKPVSHDYILPSDIEMPTIDSQDSSQ